MAVRRKLAQLPRPRFSGTGATVGAELSPEALPAQDECPELPASYIGWDDDELWEATAETGTVSDSRQYGPEFPFVARLSNVPPEDYAGVVWTAVWTDSDNPGSPVPPAYYSSGAIFVVHSERTEDCNGMIVGSCNAGVLSVTADYDGVEYGPITLTLTDSGYYDDYCSGY